MLFRPALMTLVLVTATTGLFTGCSSRPENSPVIKKKFAEVDDLKKTIDTLEADNRLVNDQIALLIEENEQLKAFLPDVDGQSAVDKIAKLEARLKQVESLAASNMYSGSSSATADAGSSTTRSRETAAVSNNRPDDLDTRPLAGTSSSKPEEKRSETVAAQQQAAPKPAPRQVTGFKEMTKPAASASKPAAPKPAASSSRGKYHNMAAGETVADVAKKHGISTAELYKVNRLPNGARLPVGQRLYIPGS